MSQFTLGQIYYSEIISSLRSVFKIFFIYFKDLALNGKFQFKKFNND